MQGEQDSVSERSVRTSTWRLVIASGVCLLLVLLGARIYSARFPKELNAVEKQLVGTWIVYRPVKGSSQQDQYILTLNSDRTSSAVAYSATTNQWIQLFTGDAWRATDTHLDFKDLSMKVFQIPIARTEKVEILEVSRNQFTWKPSSTAETLHRATEKELQQAKSQESLK